VVDAGFAGAIRVLQAAQQTLGTAIVEAAETLSACFERGGKLLVCGNGGSAAEAQHFAAEFVGRLRAPARTALPAIALTADGVMLTAWANDASFDEVFSRQVEAFGRPGDVLVAISTSGCSRNVTLALQAARRHGLRSVALLGCGGGEARAQAEIALVVPSDDTQHVQEAQLVVIHLLAELVDRAWRQQHPDDESRDLESMSAVDRVASAPCAPADGMTGDPALAGGPVGSIARPATNGRRRDEP
jgi:phosphoheptose isomerase